MTIDEAVELLRTRTQHWNVLRYKSDVPSFRNVNLGGADLSLADCRNLDFRGADLNHARFSSADFSGADLRGAKLQFSTAGQTKFVGSQLGEAGLYSSILVAADFTDANLTNTDFHNSDLRRACFVRGKLKGTKLSGAALDDADFSDASIEAVELGGTRLVELDFSVVAEPDGLRSVIHHTSSSISTDTLAQSMGKLPSAFLRGCGLSEWEIEVANLYDPQLSPKQVRDTLQRVLEIRLGRRSRGGEARNPLPRVFISYSHIDRRNAEQFEERLIAAGIDCFRDEKDIGFGGDIPDQVLRAIRTSTHLVVLFSPAVAKASWPLFEIGVAKGNNLQIVPYLLHPSIDVPGFLAGLKYVLTPKDETRFIEELRATTVSVDEIQ
jgi:uncharacterized protein YjbI with pentapeptide repeats